MDKEKTAKSVHKFAIVPAKEIYDKDFPQVQWAVDGLLQQGVTLISGDPKVGKSFLLLQIAIAVAGGEKTVMGNLKVSLHGPVLYISADDPSEPRTQNRLESLGASPEALDNIDFIYLLPEKIFGAHEK